MQSSETARLRGKIDVGDTGSKVRFPDMAAAPLGTDDEAAGEIPQGAASVDSAPSSTGYPSEPEGQEDNRAPTNKLPTFKTWMVVFGTLAALLIVLASASWFIESQL